MIDDNNDFPELDADLLISGLRRSALTRKVVMPVERFEANPGNVRDNSMSLCGGDVHIRKPLQTPVRPVHKQFQNEIPMALTVLADSPEPKHQEMLAAYLK